MVEERDESRTCACSPHSLGSLGDGRLFPHEGEAWHDYPRMGVPVGEEEGRGSPSRHQGFTVFSTASPGATSFFRTPNASERRLSPVGRIGKTFSPRRASTGGASRTSDGRSPKTLDEAGIPGGASVILAHEVKEKEALAVTGTERQRADFLRQRQAKVTQLAYGGAQHLALKREAIKVWCDAVLCEYARQQKLRSPKADAA